MTGIAAGVGVGNIVYVLTVVFVAQRVSDWLASRAVGVIARSIPPLVVVVGMCRVFNVAWPVESEGGFAEGLLLRTQDEGACQ